MMASNRAASPPAAEPEPPAPETSASVPSPPTPPAPAKLKPSPFLHGFDLVLALGCVVLGFGVASFAVRNSDFWQHLGIGRTIAQGQYEFGKAPFTYIGADRTWINHSWLYDWMSYTLYNGFGGRSIVIFKAILIALLTFLLLRIKRPDQSLWLGVLTVGLALLASAPYLVMQPTIVSCILLGVILFLLTSVPSWSSTWKLPLALGATCWLWANCDQWFFLGPLTIALYLIGEQFLGTSEPNEQQPSSRKRILLISFGISVVACMLNPHHFRIWQLPPELISGSLKDALGSDPHYAPLFRRLFEKGSLDFTGGGGGNPVNAFAFVLLLLLNVVGFLINAKNSSMGLMLVNAALFVLAFFHARALPFYAIAAAPITALNLGQYLERVRDRSYLPGTLQLFAASRVFARMMLLVVGLLAITACYPGWLHPFNEQRRLSWDVVPDPALVKTAQTLDSWRAEGKIPPAAHSLILNTDLAHYCAWYAPSEQTYFDLRLGLNAPEAENFINLKKHFHARKSADFRQTVADATRFVDEQGIVFLVLASQDRDELVTPMSELLRQRHADGRQTRRIWELWDISGRTVIFGRTQQTVLDPESFRTMRYSPMAVAFGEGVERIPDPGPLEPPAPRDFAVRFLTPSQDTAAGTDEALLLNEYQIYQGELYVGRQSANWHAQVFSFGALASPFVRPTSTIGPEFHAASLALVRAARRGILASPNSSEGYFALAQGYASVGWHGYADGTKQFVRTASLERYMAHLTPDQRLRPSRATQFVAATLYQTHQQTGRLDLAYQALQQLMAVLQHPPEGLDIRNLPDVVKGVEQELRERERELRNRENLWLTNSAQLQNPVDRALSAEQAGLPRKALQMLNEVKLDETVRISPEQRYRALFGRIQLNLLTGQAEEADRLIKAIDEQMGNELNRPEARQVRFAYLELKMNAFLVIGRFDELAKMLYVQEAELKSVLENFTRQKETFEHVGQHLGRRLAFPLPFEFKSFLFDRGGGFATAQPKFEFELLGYILIHERREQVLFRLGMTCLEQANNRTAATHFDQCIQLGQKRAAMEQWLWGFEHPARRQLRATAKMYLDLLRGD